MHEIVKECGMQYFSDTEAWEAKECHLISFVELIESELTEKDYFTAYGKKEDWSEE